MIKVTYRVFDRKLIHHFPLDTTQKYIEDYLYSLCYTYVIISMKFALFGIKC